MYLLRHEADFSLPQIGQALGGRDHTTVMYAIKKIANELVGDDRLRRLLDSLKQQLHAPAAPA
jgi:chromosomal replication initiator protein